MKKTLLMMAAALTAWSASAQLYVTGLNVEGQGGEWDPANALEVTEQNGVYTFQATDNFKMSTAKGSWDNFDNGGYQLSGAWNKGTSTATGTLTQGNANIVAPMEGVKITYTVKSDLSSITATLPEGMTFGEAPVPDFYLVGDFNNWTLADASAKMSRNGNVYTITSSTEIAGKWKINNGSWNVNFGQGEEGMPVMGTTYNLASDGGNLTTTIPAGTKVTFTYNEGGVSTLLLGEGGGSSEVTTPDHLYIVGALSTANWTPDNTPEMTKSGNTFSISNVELIGDANFSFLTTLGGWDVVNTTDRYGAEAGFGGVKLTFVDNVATAPVVKAVGDVKSFNAVPGKYDITVTFDAAGVTLTVTKVGEAVVVEDLVLTGSFNDWARNDHNYLMTKNENTYTITLPSMEAGTEFKVKTAEENWTTSWGAEGYEGMAPDECVAVTVNTPMNAWSTSTTNFKLEEALNNVTITFVKSDDANVASTLTVAGTSAIETVEAAAAEATAEYYNLQGIRILTPEAGQLYIVNRAGKISKEIAR